MIGKNYAHDEVRREAATSKVESMFAAMDIDRDDFISLEEFRDGVDEDPNILRVIQQGI